MHRTHASVRVSRSPASSRPFGVALGIIITTASIQRRRKTATGFGLSRVARVRARTIVFPSARALIYAITLNYPGARGIQRISASNSYGDNYNDSNCSLEALINIHRKRNSNGEPDRCTRTSRRAQHRRFTNSVIHLRFP